MLWGRLDPVRNSAGSRRSAGTFVHDHAVGAGSARRLTATGRGATGATRSCRSTNVVVAAQRRRAAARGVNAGRDSARSATSGSGMAASASVATRTSVTRGRAGTRAARGSLAACLAGPGVTARAAVAGCSEQDLIRSDVGAGRDEEYAERPATPGTARPGIRGSGTAGPTAAASGTI